MVRYFAPLLGLLLLASCTGDTSDLPDAGGQLKCTTNDDCPAGQRCEMGGCVPDMVGGCEVDDDCGEGEICGSDMMCIEGCNAHEDCEEGEVCLQNLCSAPERCDDTGMCTDGLVCNSENLCVPPGEGCVDDTGCEEDELCIEGECTPEIACQTSDDCPADLRCIESICRAPCEMDEDCGGPPGVFACDTDTGECVQRCFQDNQCAEGFICENFNCGPAECTQDDECDTAADEVCDGEEDGHGRCIVIVRCMDQSDCPQGSLCNQQTGVCDAQPACRTDRDCAGGYCDGGFCFPAEGCNQNMCADGFECVADICVPGVCRSDADCDAMTEICLAGTCTAPPSPNFVTEVRIITPAGAIRPQATYPFVALALDQAGRVVHGVTFEWDSSVPAVAAIDAQGVATGGATAGTTEIRATVQTSNGPVVSSPVELINLGPVVAGDVRVSVVRATNGTPISGAQVEITGNFGSLTAMSDAGGLATFVAASPTGPFAVTIAHADHDYVSVLDNTSADLQVALPPLSRPSIVAGVSGSVDLSQVLTTGALSLSLSGTSVPSPLINFSADGLFGGDLFSVNVPIPQVPPIPLAGGNTVEVEIMGFPLALKTTYYARAQPGLRAIWSFGGKTGINNGGGLGDLGNIATAILPLFNRFEHTVVPAVNLVGIPTIGDVADINGNGDTAEQVPDWLSFPTIPLTPNQSQRLRFSLSVSPLPFVEGGNANALIIISGVVLPGLGFVPLGMDGQSDDMGSGIVPTFVTKMAPPHGGLEAGEYAVLATAVRYDMGEVLPGPGSSRLFMAAQLPTLVDMSDGWLDSPLDATWSGQTRQVTLPTLPGADLYKVGFQAADGAWHVYSPVPPAGNFTMPAPPMGMIDRTASATVTVDAVDLQMGTPADTLFDVTAGGAIGLDRATRGFSRAVIGQ